jgi:hypothetical protein
MRVPDDVRQALAYDPAEQFAVRWVDHVDGAGQVGRDAGRAQQLASAGQFRGEGDIPVAADGGPDVAEGLPCERLDFGDLP